MKKYLLKSGLLGVAAIALSAFFAGHAFAMQPTLSLSSYNVPTVNLSVYGDANSSIVLEYQTNYGMHSTGVIGTTNSYGSFSSSINSSSYGIPSGQQVFVLVNGQQSQSVTWPYASSYQNTYSYNNSYTYPYSYPNYSYSPAVLVPLTLGSTTATLTTGQSQSVQILGGSTSNTYSNYSYNSNYYGTGSYQVSSNQNQNVASASINGSTLTIYGLTQGSTIITVCQNSSYGYTASNAGCAAITVTVSAPYYYNNYQYGNYNYQNNYSYPYNQSYQTYPYTNSYYNNSYYNNGYYGGTYY